MIRRQLTARELAVLEQSDGKTNRELAEELLISKDGVAQLLSRVYMKLGVPGKRDALALARRRKLIPFIGNPAWEEKVLEEV